MMHRQTVTGTPIVSPLTDPINAQVYANLLSTLTPTIQRAADTLKAIQAEYNLSDADAREGWQALVSREYQHPVAWLVANKLGITVPQVYRLTDRVGESIQHGAFVQKLNQLTVIEQRETTVKMAKAKRPKTEWMEALDLV